MHSDDDGRADDERRRRARGLADPERGDGAEAGAMSAGRGVLLRPRSIAGAVPWGLLAAAGGHVAITAGHARVSSYRGSRGPARAVSTIAVGSGYSIDFAATRADPFLAEYRQERVVFRTDAPGAGEVGRIGLPGDTGGRVRVGVYLPADPKRLRLALADRHVTSIVDLKRLEVSAQVQALPSSERVPLGVVPAESLPIRFIPCLAWSRLPEAERARIGGPDPRLARGCQGS